MQKRIWKIATASVFLAGGILQAQNLIRDPDFDKGSLDECHISAHEGTVKSGIITEDRTWNKCLAFEILKYKTDPKTGKRTSYLSCLIGKDKGRIGFKAEPDTIYEFQFECKGKLVPRVQYAEWNGPDFRKNRKTKRADLELRPLPSGEWTVVKGSFKTSHDVIYAALNLELFGGDEWKNLPPLGPAFMIDKVRIEKKAPRVPGAVQTAEGRSSVPCFLPGKTYSGFILLKNQEKAFAQTFCSCVMKNGKMVVDVRCMEPSMGKISAKTEKDGGDVWQDDCVEIFFSSGNPKRLMNQFVVTAGGIRWMGRGKAPVSEYGKWSASVRKESGAWTVHGEFPLSLLGWNKAPEAKETIRFFIARNRTAGQEVSSIAPVKNGFHDKRCWGVFFPYGLDPWFKAVKQELLTQASGSPTLAERIRKWTSSGTPEQDLAAAESFRENIADLKLAGQKFVITCNPVTTDPEIPFFPASLADPPKKITVRSAGNDVMFVALAVTNMSGLLEEYRVVVSSLDRKGDETNRLETADGKIYPAEKMTLYRGIRVKNINRKSHGMRYDPLVPMDVSQTVIAAPRESIPVWIKFNTKDVTPGVYRGVVRVIPLSEPSERNNPAYRDVPFSFEVLPFALTRDFPVPHSLFQNAVSRDCFRQMLESHVDTFLLSPYRAGYGFDAKGNLTGKAATVLEQNIREYQEWAKEFGAEGKIRYCLCYNVYRVFMERWTKKILKPFSPEWEKAWTTYMKEIDSIRQKYNIPADRWSIELADEPNEKQFPELLRAAELAAKANPEIRLMMTFSTEIPEPELLKLVPYVHEWCLHGTRPYYTTKKYARLLAELRRQKKMLSIYTCSTSMREDLRNYYRRLPWTVPCYDIHGCNLYQHTNYQYRFHDWKEAAEGEVALIAGPHTVTTIRGECLNAGFSDLQYYLELKDRMQKIDRDSPLGKEIREFLDKAPETLVMDTPVSRTCFEEAREKMIDLILKYQKHEDGKK